MIGNISTPGGIRPVRFGAGIGAIGGDTYRQAVVNTGPVSYWRLGEKTCTNAADEMGANAGTYVGSPTLGVAGLLAGDSDTAVAFNGTTQGVEMASVPSTGDVFTVAIWVQQAAVGTQRHLWSFGTGSAGLFVLADDTLWLIKDNIAEVTRVGDPSGFTDTTSRHFIVITKDGPSRFAYLDGVDVTANGADQTMDASTTFALGKENGYSSDFFPGTFDEPAIWDRALTADEIAMLNAIGRGTW